MQIQALSIKKLDSDLRKKLTTALHKLCGLCDILPTSHVITDGLELTSHKPTSSGGFSDVYPGRYQGRPVAIKSLRVEYTPDVKKVKKVCPYNCSAKA